MRVWHEPTTEDGPSSTVAGPDPGLRGSIEIVGRPVRRYFVSLDGMTEIIAEALGTGRGGSHE